MSVNLLSPLKWCPKKPFETRIEAQKARRHRRHRRHRRQEAAAGAPYRLECRVYKCAYCGAFHLTLTSHAKET